MKPILLAVSLAFMLLIQGPLSAEQWPDRPLAPAEIEAAINEGLKAADVHLYRLTKTAWSYAGWVSFSTPYLRVALAANDAKRKYKTFAVGDVTETMIAPELHVYAEPRAEGRSTNIINVDALVITRKSAKDPSQAIHPTRTEELPSEFRNLLGYRGEGRGLLAVFPLSVLSEQHEIHVIYDQRIYASRNDSGTDVAIPIKLKNVR